MNNINLTNYRVVMDFYNDKPEFLQLVQSDEPELRCYLLENQNHELIAVELSENNFVLVDQEKVLQLNHNDLITVIGKVNNLTEKTSLIKKAESKFFHKK